MSEIFCLLQSVSSLGCDAATYASTACGCNAWGSLSSSSNKLSNEGNYSGKKAVGLGNPSKLGGIRGGRGDGLQPPPAPPPEPLPSPSGPSSSGRFKASSLLLIFSSSAALNSFFYLFFTYLTCIYLAQYISINWVLNIKFFLDL